MACPDHNKLMRLDLGRTRYADAWKIQKLLLSRRAEGRIPDCLLTTEHEPAITMGRGTDRRNLLVTADELREKGIDLFEVERGGDITFHGPGQAVLYPIIDLTRRGRDVRRYLRDLEAMAIHALKEMGLSAGVKKGLTGIWVDDRKVGAIGVAMSRWITYHGLALNVDTGLEYFDLIIPCGITQYKVASISDFLGRPVALGWVTDSLVDSFARHFGYEVEVAPSS